MDIKRLRSWGYAEFFKLKMYSERFQPSGSNGVGFWTEYSHLSFKCFQFIGYFFNQGSLLGEKVPPVEKRKAFASIAPNKFEKDRPLFESGSKPA